MTDLHKPLSIKQAAKFLGISRSSIYRLINRGELKRIKVCRRTLITRKAMDNFIDSKTEKGVNRK